MLIFTRKSRESVVVGRTDAAEPMLRVTVLAVRGGRVRLGIEGDASVPVHRAEVWERIQADSEAAGGTEGSNAPIA